MGDDQGGITSIAFRDGYLLSGGHGGVLTMWDVGSADFDTLEGHTDDITHIQLEEGTRCRAARTAPSACGTCKSSSRSVSSTTRTPTSASPSSSSPTASRRRSVRQ